MFAFNVITWNSGLGRGSYTSSVDNILFGGSSGHAAAELVIPATEENIKLIKKLNTKNKLLVKETVTLIPSETNEPPGHVVEQVPSLQIYFSFWGDVTTKKTPEEHRMVDKIRDRLEEGRGVPVEYSHKAKSLFGENDWHFNRLKWVGFFGSIEGQNPISTIFHQRNKSASEIRKVDELTNKLNEIESEKEILLFRVRDINDKLFKLNNYREKEAYLDTEEVQDIFERYNVFNLEELERKLLSLSMAITIVREQLEELDVQFGLAPDNIVSFPINDDSKSNLDYRSILRRMAFIANNPLPYHVLRRNCSSVVVDIINSGVNDEMRTHLEHKGFKIPSSNILFETPQSAYKLASDLSEILSKSKLKNSVHKEKKEFHLFVEVKKIMLSILAYFFSGKPQAIIENNLSLEDELSVLKKDKLFLIELKDKDAIGHDVYEKMMAILELKIQALSDDITSTHSMKK